MAEWSGGENKIDGEIRIPAPLFLRVIDVSDMAAGCLRTLTTLRSRLGARRGGHRFFIRFGNKYVGTRWASAR